MDSLRNFGFLLKDVLRLYSLNFERHAVGLNLTLAQCRVLCYLQRNEGISQVRLAVLTDTDPMTLVRILDRMEGDGLVERRPDPDDRRARRLFLRASANPMLKEIWRFADRARAESLLGLSGPDRAQLVNLMRRTHSNLDKLIPGAADVTGTASGKSRKRTCTPAKSFTRERAATARG
ncbi:MAG TPA: MarR family transcriptional regulator [Burkholderiales bacterium]|nr:MarR family transcriptional regulator [Burkholderiales bacterium]